MKLEEIVYDNYLSKVWCDFCCGEVTFNSKAKRATYFVRQGKKSGKTITKHWHIDCFNRVETVLGTRAGRAKNPVGNYGARNGG